MPAFNKRLETVLGDRPMASVLTPISPQSLQSIEASPAVTTVNPDNSSALTSVENASTPSTDSLTAIPEVAETKRYLVCKYGYFSLFWIFSTVTSKSWSVLGDKRSDDLKLSNKQVKSIFGGKIPGVGWWSQYSLIGAFMLIVLTAVVPVAWASMTGQPLSSSFASNVESGGQIRDISSLTVTDLEQPLVWEPTNSGQVKSRKRVILKNAENAEFIAPAAFITAQDQEIVGYFKILNKQNEGNYFLQDLTLVTPQGQIKLTYPDGKPTPEQLKNIYQKLGQTQDMFPLSMSPNIQGFKPNYQLDNIEGFIFKDKEGVKRAVK